MFTVKTLSTDNRMLRAGIGKHQGRWFVRIDLWFVWLRLSGKEVKPVQVPRGWYNAHSWSDNIPMNMLPFFVYLQGIRASTQDGFDFHYGNFCVVMDIKEQDRTRPEFIKWCNDQFTHFYECSH